MKRCEVWDCCKLKNLPNAVHLFEIPDDGSVILFPIFFEEKDGQELMLGVISSRIFTGVSRDM